MELGFVEFHHGASLLSAGDDNDHPASALHDLNHGHFSALWHLNKNNNGVCLHNDTIDNLATKYASLLGVETATCRKACVEMATGLGVADYAINQTIFKMEGGWLLKNQSLDPSGLIKLFLFWLAFIDLRNQKNAMECFLLFQKQFGSEMDLSRFSGFSDEEIFDAFVSCLFCCINKTEVLFSCLKTKNLPYRFHEKAN
jgi:hypothetical protein